MQESDGLKPSVHLGPLIEDPNTLTKNVVYWKDNLVLCCSSAHPSPPPPQANYQALPKIVCLDKTFFTMVQLA